MYKWMTAILACLISSVSFAQEQTTLFGTDKSTGAQGSTGPLSPDQFESRVKSLHKKNMDKINQDISKTLKPPVKQDKIHEPPHTETPAAPTQPAQPKMPEQQQQPAVVPQQQQVVQPTEQPAAAPMQENTMPAAPPSEPAPAAPAQAPSQPYTGFQGGNEAAPAPSNSTQQQSGGGWNIKY